MARRWSLIAALVIAVSSGGTARAQTPSNHDPGQPTELQIVEQRARRSPGDAGAQAAFCRAAEEAELYTKLARCAERLRTLTPDDALTWYWSSLAAYHEGEIDFGDSAARRARELGLLQLRSDELDRARVDSTAFGARLERTIPKVLGWWLVGLVALALVGVGLSASTARALRTPDAGALGRPRGLEAALRRVYGVVLWSACAYYYVSLPLVLLTLVVAAGVLMFSLFAAGYWTNLYFVIPAVVVATIAAVIRSFLADKRPSRAFDDPVDLDETPALRAVLEEVARRVGTRPIDAVYLTPGIDLGVTERGSLLGRLTGASKRCLLLGAGVLQGMRLRELKAVLAHEYGHFQNEDTAAGGAFALTVRRSLETTHEGIVRSRADRGFNPAWWFFFGFHRLFLRISLGAARLQETLADRWAARAYGRKSFVRGLKHVVRQTVSFDLHVKATVTEVVREKIVLENLYAYEPAVPIDDDDANRRITAAWKRRPSPYDSHPSPDARVAMLKALDLVEPDAADDDDDDAWSLFPDRASIEEQMTRRAIAKIENEGIRFPVPKRR